VTAADVQKPPPGMTTGLRLVRLHLASRQIPMALTALAACAVLLRIALRWQWIQGSGPLAQQVPVMIEGGTAVVIAVTTRSAFGELERATGQWLPWLRLGTALTLTAASAGALGAGAAAAHLPGGILPVLRNVAGLTGIGLLSAAILGGALAWAGPLAYAVVAEVALTETWTTPLIWPARPPHALGAAICAALVFTAGTVVFTAGGARDSARE
jgi:hypothetical protein